MRPVAAVLIGLVLSGVAAVQAQEIPRPAQDYVITLPNGQKTSVSAYKGKVVALEFLLTTCSHCQATAKTLTQLAKELGPKGFQPLGVAINPDPDVPGFVKEFGVTYPVGTGPRDPVYAFLQHSVMSPNLMMPQLVFIDRSGMVRAQYEGTADFFKDEEKNMRALIEKLLAEPAKKTSGTKSAIPVRKRAL